MDFVCRKLITKLSEIILRNGTQVRFYPRWSHRRPRRVLSPEEYQEMEAKYEPIETKRDEYQEIEAKYEPKQTKRGEYQEKEAKYELKQTRDVKQQKTKKQKSLNNFVDDLNEDMARFSTKPEKTEPLKKASKRQKVEVVGKKKTTTDMLDTVIDSQGNFIYTKLKNRDPQVGKIMLMVKSRKEKEKNSVALLEGKRIIQEALHSGCLLKYLLFSNKNDVEILKHDLPKSGAKLLKMPYREMQMWSDLVTCPGIMGVFKIPNVEDYKPPPDSLSLTIVCDNLREPGNLGAVLRVAAGVGAEKVLLTKGCANLWETKVIRSASGAHFKLQIHSKLSWPSVKEHISEHSNIFIADNNIISENVTSDSISNTESRRNNFRMETLQGLVQSVPVLPYYSVNFSELDSLILIVGGETEGISEESYALAAEHRGARLHIPLSNSIDSLNTGTALGIIAFEIRRQFWLGKREERRTSDELAV